MVCIDACMQGCVHAWRVGGACVTTLQVCSSTRTAPPRRAAGLTLTLTLIAAGGAAQPLRAHHYSVEPTTTAAARAQAEGGAPYGRLAPRGFYMGEAAGGV